MRVVNLTMGLLIAALVDSSAFAQQSDAQFRAQYEANISSLTKWSGVYDAAKGERCTLQKRKTSESAEACVKAFDILVLRFKTEIAYNQLRILALSHDLSNRTEIFNSVLLPSVVDDFNKETRRIEGWVVNMFPTSEKQR